MATLSWSDVSGTAPAVTNPKMGGLMKSEDGTIITFVGTDPDAQVNVFSYDAIEQSTHFFSNRVIQINRDQSMMDNIVRLG
jgi:hypothetical protein